MSVYIVLAVVMVGIFLCGFRAGKLRGRAEEFEQQDSIRLTASRKQIDRLRQQLGERPTQERI